MKYNFENCEIVRADGLSTIYFQPYDKSVTKEKIMDRVYKRVKGTCDKEKMSACMDKLTASSSETYKSLRNWANLMNWTKASDGDPTPKYNMYKFPEDMIKNFGMSEEELQTLVELIMTLEEEDNDDMMEMCDGKTPSLTNADMYGTSCCCEKPEAPIEISQSMMDMLMWGFKPTVGSFTVGHSLLQFGVPNGNKDLIPTDKIHFYLDAIVGQACTWQHDQEVLIGSVCNATVHNPSNVLLLNTKFWESRIEVADLVEQVKEKYRMKDLKFSFEK